MENGCGITNSPLPIETLTTIPKGHYDTLYVKHCPIFGFLFKCCNIMVFSYGCTYHAFCMGVHLKINKGVLCARATCGKFLSWDWMTSQGFNQVNMLLKNPKLEKSSPKVSGSTNQIIAKSKLPSSIVISIIIHMLNSPWLDSNLHNCYKSCVWQQFVTFSIFMWMQIFVNLLNCHISIYLANMDIYKFFVRHICYFSLIKWKVKCCTSTRVGLEPMDLLNFQFVTIQQLRFEHGKYFTHYIW